MRCVEDRVVFGIVQAAATYVLDEGALVLEGVTLAQVVELVVEVLVDLAGGTVADEETTENTHAAHPEDLAVEQKEHLSATANQTSLPFFISVSNMHHPHRIIVVVRMNGGTDACLTILHHWSGLHTWAYGPPWYPYAYPDRGVCRFCGPR